MAEPDVSYSYAEAVADGVCRPVCFVAYDGSLSWRSGDDVIESSFETVLSTREASRRYRTAISTDLPDGLPRILKEADAKLAGIRQDGHRDAAGLVVAADSEHARRIAKLLREATGRAPLVVLHAETRAAAKLAAFTGSTDPWIVAVNMVSEGVDIPRLRVGVYATAAKTPLIFRQIVGRFVRTLPRRPAEPSWLYVPADPVLRDHAATIEQELRGSLRRPGEEDPFALDEREERRETERSETPEFVPLSADVAPQMTLFGAPAPPPPSAAAARWVTAMADAEPHGDSHGIGGRAPRDPGVRAARPVARRAPPPGVRGPAPRRDQPPRDQRLAEPQDRDHQRGRGDAGRASALGGALDEQAHAAPLTSPRSRRAQPTRAAGGAPSASPRDPRHATVDPRVHPD